MIEALLDDGYTLEEVAAELEGTPRQVRALLGRNGRQPELQPPKRPTASLERGEQIRRVAREMAFLQGVRWSEMTPEGKAAVSYLAELALRAVEAVDAGTRWRVSGKRMAGEDGSGPPASANGVR